MSRLFAIIDCNNFYVSCERVFQPELRNRPLVVLSNNDGCIIARSNEAKALGIEMGAPYFKIKTFCEQHNVIIRSSNYTLYGDMSHRIVEVLQQFEPRVEVYSIDEVFVELLGIDNINLSKYLNTIVNTVKQQIGVPISIGVGLTKTLAKIAVYQAKKRLKQAVCILETDITMTQALLTTPINEIWGIGKQWSQKLIARGITSAFELTQLSPEMIRQQFNIVMANTVREIQGYSCLSLELVTPPKQNIMSSRSFGKRQSEYLIIAEALSHFCARACEKLRAQRSLTKQIQVFLKTNRFKKERAYYSRTAQVSLPQYTSDTSTIIFYAKKGLRTLFKQGLHYHKTGIILGDLIPEDTPIQQDLFGFQGKKEKQAIDQSRKARRTLDNINQRFGKDVLFLASQKMTQDAPWAMRQKHCSHHFTTNWNEILTIKK